MSHFHYAIFKRLLNFICAHKSREKIKRNGGERERDVSKKELRVFSWWFPVKSSKWENAAKHHLNAGMFSIYWTLIWFALRCNSERRVPPGRRFSAQPHLTTFSVWAGRRGGRSPDQILDISVLQEEEQGNTLSLRQTRVFWKLTGSLWNYS